MSDPLGHQRARRYISAAVPTVEIDAMVRHVADSCPGAEQVKPMLAGAYQLAAARPNP